MTIDEDTPPEVARLLRELEGEGFRDKAKLNALKEQIRVSYASAPPEFLEEARRADPFNDALPPMDAVEIAAEFAKMAGSAAERAGEVFEKSMTAPDWDSLRPDRKRSPREGGNKIDITKKEGGGGGDDE